MVVVESAAAATTTIATVAKSAALGILPASIGPLAMPTTKWGATFAAVQISNIYGRAKQEMDSPMKYSKGASMNESGLKNPIPSKAGMFLFYCPALVASSIIFLRDDFQNYTAGLLAIHFLKRVLETLFLHKYSGNMDREAV